MPEHSSGRWSTGLEPLEAGMLLPEAMGKKQRQESGCHSTCLALSKALLCCSLTGAQGCRANGTSRSVVTAPGCLLPGMHLLLGEGGQQPCLDCTGQVPVWSLECQG